MNVNQAAIAISVSEINLAIAIWSVIFPQSSPNVRQNKASVEIAGSPPAFNKSKRAYSVSWKIRDVCIFHDLIISHDVHKSSEIVRIQHIADDVILAVILGRQQVNRAHKWPLAFMARRIMPEVSQPIKILVIGWQSPKAHRRGRLDRGGMCRRDACHEDKTAPFSMGVRRASWL